MEKKKKGDEEENTGDPSVVLFTALNLILLTLFIYLNSISIKDNKKQRVALGSLTGAFGIMPGGLSPSKGDVPLPLDTPTLMVGEVGEDAALARLTQFLHNMSLKRGISVNYKLDEVAINFSSDILFEKGSTKLNEKFIPALSMIGNLIIYKNYYVRIEGHTDDSKNDTSRSKWELSAERAVSVLRYFSDNFFLDPDTITAVGYGQYKPIAPNNSSKNRASNRRVEVILMEEKL